MKTIEIKGAWQGNSDCESCAIRSSVLFAELNEEDFSKIHAPIDDFSFEANAELYAQGDSAEYVYTLREGYIKLLHFNPDGTARIVRLVRPGDLFGMESLLDDLYKHSAIALTNIHVCKIPKKIISSLGDESPRMHRQIVKKWGEALSQAEAWFSEINTGRIEIRLARFFLQLSRQSGENSVAPLFKREDMGLMMDVKFETISRALASMAEQGLIANVSKLSVQIPDLARLKAFAKRGMD
ncbi:Crp/Fnr family transcriptional regulator [Polynucleobacter sphagniphilus]|jgi:CRP-like cAMP-binding protein|uniref:CRP-like cAMP-binding protein n=1 Tax=Polynucleobacter sphagniphilus TaxID=1743169 RepID=A0AA43S5Q3_9BURK|nr:Crp/Fnr family transcriptional regulator [Polynucleobacter sphagniphilus]MDF9789194.1 CRP-like cAMP-binding protein [Polynucleobacter sphagniphilus]MDH6503096.1 CRP-like cAMP-binding protein [Polynucleobacter sphagniphilus]MDH6511757.1 CRP-like cAMP-binding protein [Polynucleobacter sphagniphilus]OLY95551.1 cyclic nucleotide-binding protein [Polynucleobacter sphagniphilus]